MTRPTFDEIAFELTRIIATRSTCLRLHTAAVIMTQDHRLVASGYNGSLLGLEHCDTIGCLLVDGHCVRTVHAEANAIAQAAKYGTSLNGCEIYVLHQPCLSCTKLIVASGITAIHYDQPYRAIDEESRIAKQLLTDSHVSIHPIMFITSTE